MKKQRLHGVGQEKRPRFLRGKSKKAVRCAVAVLLVLVLAVGLCAVHDAQSRRTASVRISLHYPEASQGLFPNKTRFHAYALISDEVLSQALTSLGLTEQVSVADLAASLSLSPVHPDGQHDAGDYISTTYHISLNAEGLALGMHAAQEVLQSICTASHQHFLQQYCDNQAMLTMTYTLPENGEPYLILDELILRARQLQRYLQSRMAQNKSFADADSGLSFVQMEKRLTQLVEEDMEALRITIVSQGVARNREQLQAMLQYRSQQSEINEQKQMAYYQANQAAMATYEQAMTAVVMIPTLDASGEYYMSRTKTALDTLARAAEASLSEAMRYRQEKTDMEYVIACMDASANAPSTFDAVWIQLECLAQTLNRAAEDLLVLDNAYIAYQSQEYMTFQAVNTSLWTRIALKKTLAELAGGAALVWVLGNWTSNKRQEGKKQHERI